MNLVDILVWVFLLFFAVKGFLKGLVREVCSLLGLAVGGWSAFSYYHPLAEILQPRFHLPLAAASFLAFALIFLAIAILFFCLGHALTTLFKIILLGGINRAAGMLLGVVEGALILCMVLYAGASEYAPLKVRGYLNSSSSARPFIVCGREIGSWWGTGIEDRGSVQPTGRQAVQSPLPSG